MDHRQVGRLWDENARAWTTLSRAGYDTYRDYLNTPAFLQMLPDVGGMRGLDIGCGEGSNTRQVAQRGARMTAVDISAVFTRHARETLDKPGVSVRYATASAVELPFRDACFDFATGFMSFMDIPETDRVLAEAFRVIKPGGFLQFSITHPCYDTPHRVNLRNQEGLTYAIEVGDYFQNLEGKVTEWLFSAAPPEAKDSFQPFKTPRFTRTLSQWFNLLIETGFDIEWVGEPRPSDETVKECPTIQDAQVVAYFLHVRTRVPAASNRTGR